MEYLLVPLAALFTSGLTLFTGFGLGTLLMPVFALFFPLDLAVAMTAVVHLLNNLFKLAMLGRRADAGVVWRFGVPAILAALLGAGLLVWLSDLQPLATYRWGGRTFEVTPVKLTMAWLMVGFAVIEALPRFEKLSFDRRYLPLGGVLSGFFGGLSGHQGALRSAFLVRSGLTREAFIATNVVIACLVDFTRLSIYAAHFTTAGIGENVGLLGLATLAAFLGAFLGNRLVEKITLRTVQLLVSLLLFLIAVGLGAGLV